MQKPEQDGTSVNSKNDIDYSTRYDDREFDHGRDEKGELEWLSKKLDQEIVLSSDSIMKMERLQERYHSDAAAAQAENKMGYWMRYLEAYERLGRMIHARYLPFHPVDDEGKQNVD